MIVPAVLVRCREALAKYKVPDAVEFVLALPKGPTSKIARKALRARS